MTAVITGDIINSRKVSSEIWLPNLKHYFSETLSNTDKWEIYRGDSFQLEVDIKKALEIVMSIKALIKSNTIIDVRMSLGIGNTAYKGATVTESNGSAFINSGDSFEKLKNDTLILRSPYAEFDDYFNPILNLVSFISDHWKPATADTIFHALNNRGLMQKEIAQILSKDNTTINKALKRGAYDEILTVIDLYSKKIAQCLN